jgi:hypothetical protein
MKTILLCKQVMIYLQNYKSNNEIKKDLELLIDFDLIEKIELQKS